MANPKHLAKLKEGAHAWFEWRRTDSELLGNNITPVHELREVDLGGANLSGMDLRGMDFSLANLIGASLNAANLFGASLIAAKLNHADLSAANMAHTLFQETMLANTDLTRATGLDTCHHHGPSIVDFRTLARSGPLPRAFLRGCGLPDALIKYLPSLLSQPIQVYSCFISYSTKDQAFADRLYADLQNKGVRCWLAPHQVRGGKKLHEQIVEAIHLQDRLLLILSEDSMNSEWVRNEIFHARQCERKKNRRVLFPIRLVSYDAIQAWNSDAAPEIAEYFIPDFSSWKDHDAYQKALERLMRDLKAEASGT
jgi:hypothetical protein